MDRDAVAIAGAVSASGMQRTGRIRAVALAARGRRIVVAVCAALLSGNAAVASGAEAGGIRGLAVMNSVTHTASQPAVQQAESQAQT